MTFLDGKGAWSRKNGISLFLQNLQICFIGLQIFLNQELAGLKLWAVFNAEKTVLNPAQVDLTKIPGNEAKIYQKRTFLAQKVFIGRCTD